MGLRRIERRASSSVWIAAGFILGAVPAARADEAAEGRAPFAVLTPLVAVELDPAPSFWPPAPMLPFLRETDRPYSPAGGGASWLTPEFLEGRRALLASDPLSDAGDPFLGIPEILIDGALSLAGNLFPRGGTYDWAEEEGRAITERFTEWEIVPRRGRIIADLAGSLVDRENRFFLNFEGSYLNTLSYELGLGDLDYGDFRYEQRKVILDAVRKAYLMKYRFRPEERIRDDAFGFRGWSGFDIAVLPPVMACYLYVRGLEREFSFLGTQVGVHLEPLSRWGHREEDLHTGAGLEWGLKGFPVLLLVSAGMIDGDVGLDFVGIGTSLEVARKALRGRHGED